MDKSTSNRSHHQRNHSSPHLDNQIDWNAIAPEVAVCLKGEPRTKSDKEWRWGTKGSFALYLENGKFSDYENGVTSGVIAMVKHCEGLGSRDEAVQWLRDNDFLPGRRTSPQPGRTKPQPKAARPIAKPPHNTGQLEYGLTLWNNALPVPAEFEHPVRRWSHGLLPSKMPMPHSVRFHARKRLVVCCVATFDRWIDAFPKIPAPQAVHVIAIGSLGEKRTPERWNTVNKRTYGRVDGCGVFVIGKPDSSNINICEGVNDALAIYEREPGAVIATLTTFSKLTNHPSLIKHIAARNPVIFPDMDEAGKTATGNLTRALRRAGATVKIRLGREGDDPADSALKQWL